MVGTENDDVLQGTFANETIEGLGGRDRIDGRGGNDWIEGGDDLGDVLIGGLGNDTILGGEGNDELIHGGEPTGSAGNDSLVGGGGNDVFALANGSDTMRGGTGDDIFDVGGSSSSALVSGGPGQDLYRLDLGHPSQGTGYTVTDFVGGAGGDLIEWQALIGTSSQFDHAFGEPSSSGQLGFTGGNPFDAGLGFLQLLAQGGDVLLQWDGDGAAGDQYEWVTLLTLEDIAPEELTADNFALGLDPHGAAIAGIEDEEGAASGDSLAGSLGNDTLRGGEGGDTLDGWAGDDSLDGGGGNDLIHAGPGSDAIDAGEGDDLVIAAFAAGTTLASGGNGADTYRVTFSPADRDFRVADFDLAEDRIDVDHLLVVSGSTFVDAVDVPDYTGGNPFDPGLGILRLLEAEGDTLLQWDRDGPGDNDYAWVTLLTLEDVLPGELGAANFVGGIPPDGSAAPGQLLEGGNGNDSLAGGFFDDTMRGLASHDTMRGGGGNDSMLGGLGNDLLYGGFGNDTLDGGDGDDQFGGAETFGDDLLVGGNGVDRMTDPYGDNTLEGGGGDDIFFFTHIDPNASSLLAGGEGRDTYRLAPFADPVYTAPLVTDFVAGEGGDLLDVDALLAGGSTYAGGDPIKLKYLRLVQSGEDVLLQADFDGAGTGYAWMTQLVLEGVLKGEITSDNFVGELIVGTEGDDTLEGGLGDDTLQGLGGDDELNGGRGGDSMEGGAGNDLYFVDDAGDEVIETSNGPGAREGALGAGLTGFIDTVKATVSYSLKDVANVENLTLGGGALNATGNNLANRLTGNGKDNLILGNGGNDTLNGGAGDDTLKGGLGSDTLVWRGDDSLVQGSSGNDTLKVAVVGLALDLTAVEGLSGIERIDLRGAGGNTLTLDAASVLALSDTDALRVVGDAGDSIGLGAGWTDLGATDGFHQFTRNGATLYVDVEIALL